MATHAKLRPRPTEGRLLSVSMMLPLLVAANGKSARGCGSTKVTLYPNVVAPAAAISSGSTTIAPKDSQSHTLAMSKQDCTQTPAIMLVMVGARSVNAGATAERMMLATAMGALTSQNAQSMRALGHVAHMAMMIANTTIHTPEKTRDGALVFLA